ncbi:MAG: hypothetical protein KDA72_08650 [Planctomycetales bacterium]|nr:hypothetical protein [Planctomycetales bacterium]
MALLQLRPTFELPVSEDRLEVIAKLEAEYARAKSQAGFLMHGEYGELRLAVVEHRLWSPHLSFYVSEREGHTLIRGRFAPRLEVWTFVWIVYLAMSFTAFFGLVLAYSQWMLGESVWGLWAAVAALVAIVTLYLVANIGQQWSSDQMDALRARLDGLLERAGVRREH